MVNDNTSEEIKRQYIEVGKKIFSNLPLETIDLLSLSETETRKKEQKQ